MARQLLTFPHPKSHISTVSTLLSSMLTTKPPFPSKIFFWSTLKWISIQSFPKRDSIKFSGTPEAKPSPIIFKLTIGTLPKSWGLNFKLVVKIGLMPLLWQASSSCSKISGNFYFNSQTITRACWKQNKKLDFYWLASRFYITKFSPIQSKNWPMTSLTTTKPTSWTCSKKIFLRTQRQPTIT